MTSCLLTVDFDYFVREDPAWDWGHSEAHDPSVLNALWPTRYANLRARGVEPASLLRESPQTFWQRIRSAGFRLDEAQQLAVADSHAHGAPWCARFAARLGGPVPVFNFDAHHDLGYGPKKQLDAWARAGRAECGSWARDALQLRVASTYNIAYPEWRNELPEAFPRTLGTTLRRRVTQRTLRELEGAPANRRVAGVLLVRSASWTPPWLDDAWRSFVAEGAALTRCTPSPTGHIDPLADRGWAEGAQLADMLAGMFGGVR